MDTRYLDVAYAYGLRSIHQIKTFLHYFENEGMTIGDSAYIRNLPSGHPLYKKHYTTVRKLMDGQPVRKNDGLGLLMRGERVGEISREFAVLVTPKGKRLGILMDKLASHPDESPSQFLTADHYHDLGGEVVIGGICYRDPSKSNVG